MKVLGDSAELLPVVPPISLLAEDSSNSNVVAIHPTALIESGAIIGKGTTIGPYCVIDGNVVIGDNCKLVAHVHVTGHTTIGPRTVISAFASLGAPPQSVNFRGGLTRLVLGADCDVRQSVTMNAGTEDGGGITEVGERGFFMANCHVGHDCHVGNDVVMANCAGLGGHCVVGDHVFIGALSGVHQHTRIGAHAMIGGVSGVREDIIPFGLAAGSFARLSGINVVGMKRRAYSGEAIRVRSVSISPDIFRQRRNGAASRRCRIEIWQQRIRCADCRIHSKQGSSGDLPPGHVQRGFMTTVNKADGMSDSPRSRLDCRTVVLPAGSTTAVVRGFIAS